jgi:hypothetical protein
MFLNLKAKCSVESSEGNIGISYLRNHPVGCIHFSFLVKFGLVNIGQIH